MWRRRRRLNVGDDVSSDSDFTRRVEEAIGGVRGGSWEVESISFSF